MENEVKDDKERLLMHQCVTVTYTKKDVLDIIEKITESMIKIVTIVKTLK